MRAQVNAEKPTPRREWVAAGDRVRCANAAMVGEVLRIVNRASVPYALVRWPTGSTGRHSLTALRRVTP